MRKNETKNHQLFPLEVVDQVFIGIKNIVKFTAKSALNVIKSLFISKKNK